MTLTTRVAILDPINPRTVHDAATLLAGGCAGETEITTGPGEIRNRPGQGLAALIWTYYGQDGPYERDPGDDNGPTCAVQVSFDMPYSCADGMGALVASFGEWLDDRGVRWMFEDEYDGSWHAPADLVAVLG